MSRTDAAHAAFTGTLLEMLETTRQTLARHRQAPPDDQARAVVLEIGRAFGGRYLPKGDDVTRAMRDAAIMADWRAGLPVSELARRYRLTSIRVHQIVAKLRTERTAAGTAPE